MILSYTSNSTGLPFTQSVIDHCTSELQWSDSFTIYAVIQGQISINYRNHIRAFHLNDIAFFEPFETYQFVNSAEAKLLCVSIDSAYIRTICPDIESIRMQRSHITNNLENPIYVEICKNLAILIFNNLKTDASVKLRLLNAANNLFATLLDAYGIKYDVEKIDRGFQTERVADILKYINSHYSERFTVSDISSHLGIHPQYFSTIFKKIFKASFVEYLTSYRVNQSVPLLVYSDESILDIALSCGFSNHKTYAAAFKGLYGMTPTKYRSAMQQKEKYMDDNPLANKGHKTDDTTIGTLSYYRQFLDLDSTKALSLKKTTTISLNAKGFSDKSFISNQETFISIGRAFACLRSDVQHQLIKAHEELGFTHLRIRDIFSDDLYIYYEDADHNPIFSWQNLDIVFDFIINAGIKPFPEIGFMPEQMASKKQYAGWQFRPNISAPKSLQLWRELIKSFLNHYIDRYGLPEVRSWYFDFWTCPDLQINPPYWHESMQDFFNFYQATYETFKSISHDLRLGTPNFTTMSGRDWYDAFFVFCKNNNIRPAYLSIHIYGCEMKETVDNNAKFNGADYSLFTVKNPNYIEEYLLMLRGLMNYHSFSKMDIIISDWNLTFLPKDYIRDTCYMGAFMAHSHINAMDKVKGMCFWSLSDIHEEYFPENTLFHGGPGMLDYHGIKKASYNTAVLINRLGANVLDKGDNFIFIKKGNVYQLLAYNLAEFDDAYELMDNAAIDNTHRYNIYKSTEDMNLNIAISLTSGEYYIKRYEVNRKYGSAYDIWSDIGFPTDLPLEIEDFVRETSVPHISYQVQEVNENLILDETIPMHGVILIEITKK